MVPGRFQIVACRSLTNNDGIPIERHGGPDRLFTISQFQVNFIFQSMRRDDVFNVGSYRKGDPCEVAVEMAASDEPERARASIVRRVRR
ncbi:MAG: hypothetical protein DLM68_09365 [Hyphomicrobiales bacterium]|nr:MAG: hypothetical protein DLM68_09365 [Hyphomicrobiales bacterium]